MPVNRVEIEEARNRLRSELVTGPPDESENVEVNLFTGSGW